MFIKELLALKKAALIVKEERSDDLDEAIDKFISQNNLRFEGYTAKNSFDELAKAIGYQDTDAFFEDNPGAWEAVIEWMKDAGPSTWYEQLVAMEDDEFMDSLHSGDGGDEDDEDEN